MNARLVLAIMTAYAGTLSAQDFYESSQGIEIEWPGNNRSYQHNRGYQQPSQQWQGQQQPQYGSGYSYNAQPTYQYGSQPAYTYPQQPYFVTGQMAAPAASYYVVPVQPAVPQYQQQYQQPQNNYYGDFDNARQQGYEQTLQPLTPADDQYIPAPITTESFWDGQSPVPAPGFDSADAFPPPPAVTEAYPALDALDKVPVTETALPKPRTQTSKIDAVSDKKVDSVLNWRPQIKQ